MLLLDLLGCIIATIFSWLRLARFTLLRNRLDRAGYYEALLAGTLTVIVVLAGAFTLQHRLFGDQLALLLIIDEEVTDLADVAIG